MREAIEKTVNSHLFTFHGLRAYPVTTARAYDRRRIVKRKAL
ncbi:hypothetical protein BGLT_07035 [Caballeronia glathei]|nr:hypothetical protein [Caballeronia glathei]CEJ96056.1 hypothetical protein BGLT_07035 [Caballeronia glathei]